MCFYAYKMAQPSIVSLLGYQGIVYRAMADILIFGLVPNSLQTTAISILILVQVVHLFYKQAAQKREVSDQEEFISSEKHNDLEEKAAVKSVTGNTTTI